MRSTSRGFLAGAAVLGGAIFLLAPASTQAQTRTLGWTETTRLEVPGTLGVMLRAMPGGLDARSSKQTLHLQGRTMIQEDGHSTLIMDAENRRFISVDHEEGTYVTITFDEATEAAREMTALLAEAQEGGREAAAEARAEQEAALEELRQAMDEAQATLDFRLTSEQTGRTQRFGAAGTAAQHFIMAELEGSAAPEGVDEAEEGTLVFLVELWQSPELPSADAMYQDWATTMADDESLRALGYEMAESAESGAVALAMWDPRIAAGLAQLAEAVEELDGTTVKSVTTVALVPQGATLDRAELLAWEPESMGDRIRAEAGTAAREAAADAARSAIRGVTGRLPRRGERQQAAEEEAEAPVVRPLLRMTTTKDDIVYRESHDDVLAPLMQRLEGYREITLSDLMHEEH